MGHPDWSKITESGKPFEEDDKIKKQKEENEELKKENEELKKENSQLRELLEEYAKKKKPK